MTIATTTSSTLEYQKESLGQGSDDDSKVDNNNIIIMNDHHQKKETKCEEEESSLSSDVNNNYFLLEATETMDEECKNNIEDKEKDDVMIVVETNVNVIDEVVKEQRLNEKESKCQESNNNQSNYDDDNNSTINSEEKVISIEHYGQENENKNISQIVDSNNIVQQHVNGQSNNDNIKKECNDDNVSETSSPSISLSKPKGHTLIFDNFVDLQTRLVLLPWKDDECVGAMIASFFSTSTGLSDDGRGDDDNNIIDVTGYILTNIQGINMKTGFEETSEIDWTDEDYTDILSAIRDAPTPIQLQFHQSDDWFDYQQSIRQPIQEMEIMEENESTSYDDTTDDDDDDDDQVSIEYTSSNEAQNDQNDSNINNESTRNNNKQFKGRFQRWGSQLAAEATKAVNVGKEIAREKVSERFLSPQSQREQQGHKGQSRSNYIKGDGVDHEVQIEEKKTDPIHEATNTTNCIADNERKEGQSLNFMKTGKQKDIVNQYCGLFLQTSSGKCVALDESLYKQSKIRSQNSTDDQRRKSLDLLKKAPPAISNTSVLVIRKCAEYPCPTLGYRYQWYKTSTPVNASSQNGTTNDGCHWSLLEGANSVMFQPSVTDVGYRVKCVVTIDESKENSTLASEGEAKLTVVSCELPFVIETDHTLFNAAMKTFVPMKDGADGMKISSFGNLIGRDEFDGIRFRIDLHTMQNDGFQGGFYMTFNCNEEVRYLNS